MTDVEDELWNIFSFYTLSGNPLDPNSLSATDFLRLAKDCQVVGAGASTGRIGSNKKATTPPTCQSRQSRSPSSRPRRKRGLGPALVNLAFASVIQRRPSTSSSSHDLRDRTGQNCRHNRKSAPLDHIMDTKNNAAAMPKSKLTYPEFLEALVVLGIRLYGRRDSASSATVSTDWSGVERHQVPGGAGTRAKPVDGVDRLHDAEISLEKLLMENVLPLASRRRPASAADAMTDVLVIHLLRLFGPGLREMFRFYAMSSSSRGKPHGMTDKGGAKPNSIATADSEPRHRSNNSSYVHEKNVDHIITETTTPEQCHADQLSPPLMKQPPEIDNTSRDVTTRETHPPAPTTSQPPIRGDSDITTPMPSTCDAVNTAHASPALHESVAAGASVDSTDLPMVAAAAAAVTAPPAPVAPEPATNPQKTQPVDRLASGVDDFVVPPAASPCAAPSSTASPCCPSGSLGPKGAGVGVGAEAVCSSSRRDETDRSPIPNTSRVSVTAEVFVRNDDGGDSAENAEGADKYASPLESKVNAVERQPRCSTANASGGRKEEAPHAPEKQGKLNSMADAMSHCSLLDFAADFGLSGALISTLEIGEIFLSCDDEDYCGDGDLSGGRRCAADVDSAARKQSAWRTEPARAGVGRVRPLSYTGFQEALVRIAITCFRKSPIGVDSDESHGSRGEEGGSPGSCLRALLTYMWRKLHASVGLALNGVRAGRARHRSNMRKAALVRSAQIFNEKMLYLRRATADGSLDTIFTGPSFVTPRSMQTATPKGPQRLLWRASTTLHTCPLVTTTVNSSSHHLRRSKEGQTAVEILRSLLAAAARDDEDDASNNGDNHEERDGGQQPRHQ